MEESTLFVPEVGKVYRNRNGYNYQCIYAGKDYCSFISSVGWVFHVDGVRMDENCRIEWDHSYGGRFDDGYIRI